MKIYSKLPRIMLPTHPAISHAHATPNFVVVGTGQTVEIRPLLEFLIPSIYRIFRASQNANRWRIINQMFAESPPLDARVKFFR